MAVNLTENAISILSRGERLGQEFKPVVQVLDVRSVNQNPSSERYRLMLSDGTFAQQGMLGTQLNDLVKTGRMQKGSVILLKEYACNNIQNRMIIIIIDMEMILDSCEPIGQPKQFILNNDDNSTPQPPPRTSPQFQPSMINQSTANVNPQPYHTSPLSSGPHAKQAVGGSNNFRPPEMGHGAAGSFSYGNSNNTSYNSPTPATRFPANNNPTINMRTAQQPAYNQPPPMYTNRGPIARNEAAPRITPISQLNPYQGRWTIKGRVTAKAELRHYNNPRGDGKVFSFDLLDSGGGEIRATCFNAVADQFYDMIKSGSVYMVSKGSLKPAKRDFNQLNSEHELVLDQNSIVTPCEDDGSIPKQVFQFKLISEIEGMDQNSIIDLIGVVTSISPSMSIMKKNGQETQKRALQLKDMSGRSVEMTLWGNFCNAEGQTIQQMCDSEGFVILAIKSGRINEFNGKAVGTLSTTQLLVNPDYPEAQQLRAWYEQEGRDAASVSISRNTGPTGRTDVRKMLTQIKDEKLGMNEKPDWITVCATVSFIRSDPFYYTACPNKINDRNCNKKVVNNGDGKWQCDKCNMSFDECDYKYILQLQLQDHTYNTWATAFQEVGEELIGMSAKDLYIMKFEDHNEEGFGEVLRRVLFQKYIFKLMIKEETYNDDARVKSTVIKAEKIQFSSDTKHLLNLLGNLSEESSFLPPKVESMTPAVSNPMPAYNNTSGYGNAGFRETSTPVTSMRNTASIPASQPGQYINNYSGGSKPIPGGGNYLLTCNSCGESGHASMRCPSVIGGGSNAGGGFDNNAYSGSTGAAGGGFGNSGYPSGGGGGGSGGTECFKCHQVGHWSRDCPSAASSGGGGRGGGGECYKCHQPGHWANNCPGTGINNVPPAYGGGSGGSGRYGNSSRQHVGGF